MGWFGKSKQEPVAGHSTAGVDLVPSLAEVVQRNGLDCGNLTVAVPILSTGVIGIKDRQLIIVYDGKQMAEWRVTSLRELFRGDQQPPSDGEMDQYPEGTVWFFERVETQLVTLADGLPHEPTDRELMDLYSTMRRRPDGDSRGPLHDAIWQYAALAVGLRPVSAAEFDAYYRRLARSARTFRMGDSTRNYMTQVRRMLRENGSAGRI